jgi:hypothetical protein
MKYISKEIYSIRITYLNSCLGFVIAYIMNNRVEEEMSLKKTVVSSLVSLFAFAIPFSSVFADSVGCC